jgi:hypothetical protein
MAVTGLNGGGGGGSSDGSADDNRQRRRSAAFTHAGSGIVKGLSPEPVHYIQGSGEGVLQMTSDGCVNWWWVGGVLPWHARAHTSDVSEDRFAGTVGWRCDADNRAG